MLSAEPEVEADNTFQDLDDFCGYQTDTSSQVTELTLLL